MTAHPDRPPRAVLIGIGVFAVLALGLCAVIVFAALRRAASDCPLCDAVDTNDPARVRAALVDGAPIDDRAWQVAVLNLSNSNGGASQIAIVRLLMEAGADPNANWSMGGSMSTRSTVQRASSTMWASAVLAQATATPDLVDVMLSHGLDVGGPAAAEALIGAVVMQRTAVVDRLLRAGVPPNGPSDSGAPSALAHAIQTRDRALIATIEAAGGREW